MGKGARERKEERCETRSEPSFDMHTGGGGLDTSVRSFLALMFLRHARIAIGNDDGDGEVLVPSSLAPSVLEFSSHEQLFSLRTNSTNFCAK